MCGSPQARRSIWGFVKMKVAATASITTAMLIIAKCRAFISRLVNFIGRRQRNLKWRFNYQPTNHQPLQLWSIAMAQLMLSPNRYYASTATLKNKSGVNGVCASFHA